MSGGDLKLDLRRKLSLAERAFVGLFNASYWLTQGHTVAFAEEMVRQHGIARLMRESRENGKAWTALNAYFGDRMHLMSAFGSFWNGCEYCSHGNLYAFNLHLFQDKGELFPLDEREIMPLQRTRDVEVLAFLEKRLAPSHGELLRLIVRQHALKARAVEPASKEDEMLVGTIGLYDWVNECSIVVEQPGPAFTALGRKRKLVDAYQAARAKWREGRTDLLAAAQQQ